MDKQLNINDILNCEDTKLKRVDTPAWGGYVMIQSMTAEARDAYEESLFLRIKDENGKVVDFERDISNARAKLIAACVLAPDGSRMFKTEEQIKLLGQKNANTMDMLFSECQKLNAISDSDIEELVGKSDANQP
jgi:uncharacterized protein YuzE